MEQQPELKRVMGPGLLLLFIVGDILGTGVYALTGDVAAEVGGAAWLPFLIAFVVATSPRSAISNSSPSIRRRPARRFTRTRHSASTSSLSWWRSSSCAPASPRRQRLPGFSRRTSSKAWTSMGQSRNRAAGVAVHGRARRGQPPRGRRERQAQRRPDHRRDHRSGGGDHGRILGLHRAVPTSTSPGSSPSTAKDKKHFPGHHHSHVAGVLRDGRLRGLGEHGRGDQGPGANLPEDAVDWSVDRRRRLHPGVDRGGGTGPGRPAGGKRYPARRGGQGRGARSADRGHPAVHHDVRGVEHRADQHADGQPADLRHGPPARAAAGVGPCTPPAVRRGWRSSSPR